MSQEVEILNPEVRTAFMSLPASEQRTLVLTAREYSRHSGIGAEEELEYLVRRHVRKRAV